MAATQSWYLKRRASPQFAESISALGLDPLLARVLYARHVDTPERIQAFLADDGALGDPFLMAGMRPAVDRLRRALVAGEPIVVYGDFDADGVSATVLLTSALRALGGHVTPYIPDRFNEAYGLNVAALTRLHVAGARLVVSVDCGVRSVVEVQHAQALGLDVIVTDHHSLAAELPPAVAVLDPKRADCGYPFKDLSGVGVAYRLAEALMREAPSDGAPGGAERYLDLVALGTIADIVPLTGENRLLARRGLALMRRQPSPGLRALLAVSNVPAEAVDGRAVGFQLGPRLNAAGRLKSAQLAYDLLVTPDAAEAQRLAAELDALNQERQRLLEEQVQAARQVLEQNDGHAGLLFVDGPDFHEGIVGLVASRLTDEFYRPALVMKRSEDTTRGSARSIEGFHITQALDACQDLLLRHGGHARAAGFTLANANLPAFRARLLAYGAEHLDASLLSRRHDVDALVRLDELDMQTPAALAQLAPFGEGNPEPALSTVGLKLLTVRAVGQEGKHLKLEVGQGTRSLPAIAFRQGHRVREFARGDSVDLIYRPDLNEWQGEKVLQLVVSAIRPSKG